MEEVTPELFAVSYAKLAALGFEQGEKKPSAIYYNWDMENSTTNMAIVLSVKEIPKNIPDGFELIEIPETDSYYINYYGEYSEMESAHNTINNYLISNSLEIEYVAIEEYITDPGTEPDPSNWLTKISYLAL